MCNEREERAGGKMIETERREKKMRQGLLDKDSSVGGLECGG